MLWIKDMENCHNLKVQKNNNDIYPSVGGTVASILLFTTSLAAYHFDPSRSIKLICVGSVIFATSFTANTVIKEIDKKVKTK